MKRFCIPKRPDRLWDP